MRDEYNALTRFADLDTQRHVTSRTYESFALEGRYRVLAQLGLTREKIQEEQIYLNPVSGYSKFHRQQFPGVELRVETEAFAADAGQIHWDQKILEPSGELVCHLQQLTQPVKAGLPFTLAGISGLPHGSVLYEPLPPWSGKGNRIEAQYTIPYADRDFAGKYNLASLWKIFEEGRWLFVEKIGLTYEKIVEIDTTSFYMGGICNIYGEVPAGRTLQLMTWIERIDKIRYWFRQDVLYEGKVLLSMRDEQLIVSLSRARPQRATPKFMEYIGKYVENP